MDKLLLALLCVFGLSIFFVGPYVDLNTALKSRTIDGAIIGTKAPVKVTVKGKSHSYTTWSHNGSYSIAGDFSQYEWAKKVSISYSADGYKAVKFSGYMGQYLGLKQNGQMDDNDSVYHLRTICMMKKGKKFSGVKEKVFGKVVQYNGNPYAGLTVNLYKGNGYVDSVRTTTDEKGEYSFKVKPGYYFVVMQAPESDDCILKYGAYREPLVVKAGKSMKIATVAAGKVRPYNGPHYVHSDGSGGGWIY